jgi:HAD superfamily hydrolase (TIGR01509 family)
MSDGTRWPALLLDLDGTLIDSVYAHVLSWREALAESGINLPVWRIHRRIGMSGGLFVRGLRREMGRDLTDQEVADLQRLHAAAYERQASHVRPLPGARELLERLRREGVPFAVATSGNTVSARVGLGILGFSSEIPVVNRDQVPYAKPNPDLFLAAAALLGVAIEQSIVVGDSIWDMLAAQRARALGVGLLSGGYGREELQLAGAFRVYEEPADLLDHLDELGIRV